VTDTLSEEDEGKSVVDASGEEVGVVAAVRHGTAYVAPDPGLTDKARAKLGVGDVEEDTFPLQEDSIEVESVTDDELRLRYER
jgi:hypothetical protein